MLYITKHFHLQHDSSHEDNMAAVLMGKEEVSFGEIFNHNFSENTLGRLDGKCWKTKHFSIPKGSRRHATLTSDEHILRNKMLMISESSII
jgi:hypothetical protein